MERSRAGGPFAGRRIVEVAQGVAGPYCTKLLADLGADVVKVELPEGDASRAEGESPETSPTFLYCNTSKRSVVLNLTTRMGQRALEVLLAGADVLVHDRSLGELGELPGHLLEIAVTPYGTYGPRSDARGGELTLGHAGGLFNLLPVRCRDVDRAPVRLGGYQVAYQSGLVAALACAAFLYGDERARRGRRIDVSQQDVVLALMAPMVAGHRYNEMTWCRVPDRPPAMGRLQVKDGYVILNAFDDHHFDRFRELLGRPAWCAGDEWLDMSYRAHHLMDHAAAVDAWALEQERDDLVRRAASLGIPVGPINDAHDVLGAAQYEARGYFVDVEHSRTGTLRYPGWPYRMERTKPRAAAAPLLGEHSDEILGGEELRSREDSEPDETSPRLPLEGVRALEFAWVWAGPYAGVLLSMLGAEVIKVEGPKRLDLTRRSVVWPRAEERPAALGVEEGMAFNTMNLAKKSVTIDLGQAEGRELARRLAASCDVVYDNMRPDALTKLGLGYEDLRALREDILVASSSGRGHGGPESSYLGYAMVHQGVGGGAHISGYADDHPTHSGGDVDLMNAITLAFAIVAALHHRAQTGEGQFIDYSQCEGVTSLLGEVLLEAQLSGESPTRSGNAHPTSAPHGVYRCWGVDRWLALEIHTDEHFAKLAEVMGRVELAEDERFVSRASRKAHETELDAIVEAWTRERDRDWLAAELVGAGLAAAPSRDAKDLYADRHLRERGSFVEVEHPTLGKLELPAAPFRVSGHDAPPRHAPLLGEHNDEVFADLGLGADEIAGLRERGVIT